MKNKSSVAYLAISLICGNAFGMQIARPQSIIVESEWTTLSPQQKKDKQRLLLADIYRLRAIKKRKAIKNRSCSISCQANANEDIENEMKLEFSKAIIESNIDKLRSLLASDCIDLNEQIEYCCMGKRLHALPLIIAASIFSNAEIVGLFLQHGAYYMFPDGSLMYHMLATFNDDESFWSTSPSFRKSIEIMRSKYLEVLQYLFAYSKFNLNENSEGEKCRKLWAKIKERVNEDKKYWDEKSLNIINNISCLFF